MDKLFANEESENKKYIKKTGHLNEPHTFSKFEVEMPFSMRVIPISK